MSKTSKKVIIGVLAAGLVCTAGWLIIREYSMGQGFVPSDFTQELRTNQVLFSGEQSSSKSTPGDGEQDSSLWERDESGDNQQDPMGQDGANFLFEGGRLPQDLAAGTISMGGSTGSDAGENQNGAGAGGTLPDRVFDVSGDSTGGGNTGGTIISGGGSGTTGGNTGGSVASTLPDPEPGKANPPMGDNYGIISKPFSEGTSFAKDDNGNAVVTIYQSFDNDPGGNHLYSGQSVTKKQIYCALYTFVKGADGSNYLWGEDALDKYVRIDSVSFDDGETWIDEFPVTIPSGLDLGGMVIRASWRLTTEGEWTQVEVPYFPERNRVMILDRKATDSLNADMILNSERQYPMAGEILSLLYYTPQMLPMGEDLTQLLPGWEEDGQPVDWLYRAQQEGRHILEPADMVPVPDGYRVRLSLQCLKNDGTVDPDGSNLGYLQTLVGVDTGKIRDFKKVGILTVPKYVQAVDIPAGTVLDAEYLRVPETVIYLADGGLEVGRAYVVEESNEVYASSDEGVLMNKAQTQMLAVPTKLKTLTVPGTVEKVALQSNNNVQKLVLECQTLEQLPEIKFENLKDCTVVVRDELMGQLPRRDPSVFVAGTGNHIAMASAPQVTYSVEQNAIVSSTGRLWGLVLSQAQSVNLSDNVTSVGTDSLREDEKLRMLVMPRSGKNVTLEEDCLSGSGVQDILCYSTAQMHSVQQQLEKAGAADSVRVGLQAVSLEGYGYYTAIENGQERTVLLDVPKDVWEFDGTVTAQDGTPVTIHVIGNNAFAGCGDLQWVELPESVDRIGFEAFRDCTDLEGVLIDNQESITVGFNALKGCGELRFVGSNAVTAVFEDGYEPVAENPCFGGFVPKNAAGYPAKWQCAWGDSEDGTYEMLTMNGTARAMGGGRMLVGVREESAIDYDGNILTSYVVRKVMRTSRVVPEHVLLPETVRIIWDGAMQQSDSLAGGFDVNWSTLDAALDTDWFGGDVVIGNKTFAYSGLQGDVVLPRDCTICDNGFAACEGITSLEAPSSYYSAIALGSDILLDCTNLKTVYFGDMAQDNGLYAGLFTGCDSLTDVYLDGTGVPKLIMEGRFAFQFNFGWDKDYETQYLRIHVPGTPGTEEYANRVMNYAAEWRYAFGGYSGGLDENGYWQMWNDVQMELMDPLTYEMPENAAVDAVVKERLTEYENRVRTMLGAEQVTEPSHFYPYHLVDGTYLWLVGAPSNVETADLSGTGLSLSVDWALDYVSTGAFAQAKALRKVSIPDTLVGIETNAFNGSYSGVLTLEFLGATPPQLMTAGVGIPFSFGTADDGLHIIVPYGAKQTYLDAWQYPLLGYEDENSLFFSLMFAHEDWSADKISAEMERLTAPVRQRLDSMIEEAEEITLPDWPDWPE